MFKIIDELKRGNANKRQALLLQTHERNVEYFSKVNPGLAQFIKTRGTGPFNIRVTDESIDIVDRTTNQPIHPQGKLFSYMSDLGDLHHDAWVDKAVVTHVWRGGSEHGKKVSTFAKSLYDELPELRERATAGLVRLPPTRDKRHFSGPTVFLGVFAGLHIMYYLNRVAINDVIIIEPNIDSFSLSCFFLDYQLLEKRFGYLNLHVGSNAPEFLISELIGRSQITASRWIRILPAYQSEQFDDILNRITLRWRSLIDIHVPMDREQRNLVYGLQNVHAGHRFLRHTPKLSANATIAVVASGPSLTANIEWLKANQDKMIILAPISCVRVLRDHGIRYDFQCTLDTELGEELLEKLRLDYDAPLIAYYKMNPDLVRRFKKVLLLHESGKANSVGFLRPFTYTHPTTGNLMSAVAAWCKPSRVIFLGLDLGFRDPKCGHVSGGWHDDDDGKGHKAEEQDENLSVAANFPESDGQILTKAYYNAARFSVEGALASLFGQGQVLNLADGARIKGAEPMHSSDLHLSEYPEKAKDLAAIEQSFSKASRDIFDIYETPGRQLIKEWTDAIMKHLEIKGKFNWPEFARCLDSALREAGSQYAKKYREIRLEIFGGCVIDMLGEWYAAMVLAESAANAERLYRKGLIELRNTLLSLPWPDELDMLLENERAEA
jgi:hypothetical protein